MIAEVRNVRYSGMVRPGETLTLDIKLRKRDGHRYDFQGTGSVDGRTAVTGRFSLAPIADSA
mgnify:CR=1 FL=1